MNLAEAMDQLRALGSEKGRQFNLRRGAGEDQFGATMGDLRTLAKAIKVDHDLAMGLWATGNLEARLLATLILCPKLLGEEELDRMVRSADFYQLAEWLGSYVVKAHPQKESLRQRWMASDDPVAARAGWRLTAERVAKEPGGLDLSALLDRIENELGLPPSRAQLHMNPQWTMNACLAEIGINHPEHRPRALDIGERLGVYRDYPTSKGCTSPFAPIWIGEIVSRQG